jgi:hypothetical protein
MKKIMVLTLSLMLVVTLAFSTSIVLAAHNPRIPQNQGTTIYNELDGCRPNANADGSVWIQIPGGPVWLGGPCCAAYGQGSVGDVAGEPVYMPNQCCNPPYFTGTFVPGNHCECFELRGLTSP